MDGPTHMHTKAVLIGFNGLLKKKKDLEFRGCDGRGCLGEAGRVVGDGL